MGNPSTSPKADRVTAAPAAAPMNRIKESAYLGRRSVTGVVTAAVVESPNAGTGTLEDVSDKLGPGSSLEADVYGTVSRAAV